MPFDASLLAALNRLEYHFTMLRIERCFTQEGLHVSVIGCEVVCWLHFTPFKSLNGFRRGRKGVVVRRCHNA